MSSVNDFVARGKISQSDAGAVVFAPTNTTYQLHLKADGAAPSNRPVEAIIRVMARKVWTMPPGGNFIQPITGEPRVIQGRVRYLDDQQMVIQAGTMILVDLPKDDSAFEMSNGPITVGAMVQVVAQPGATLSLRETVGT